ncbi:MAG: hypothetical protein ACFC03_01405 [Candidatus Malihini olakiniferum]
MSGRKRASSMSYARGPERQAKNNRKPLKLVLVRRGDDKKERKRKKQSKTRH